MINTFSLLGASLCVTICLLPFVRSVSQHYVSLRSFWRNPARASWPIWCCEILRNAATGCPGQGSWTRHRERRVMFWKSLSEQRDWTQILLLCSHGGLSLISHCLYPSGSWKRIPSLQTCMKTVGSAARSLFYLCPVSERDVIPVCTQKLQTSSTGIIRRQLKE